MRVSLLTTLAFVLLLAASQDSALAAPVNSGDLSQGAHKSTKLEQVLQEKPQLKAERLRVLEETRKRIFAENKLKHDKVAPVRQHPSLQPGQEVRAELLPKGGHKNTKVDQVLLNKFHDKIARQYDVQETRQRIFAENKLKHDKVAPVRQHPSLKPGQEIRPELLSKGGHKSTQLSKVLEQKAQYKADRQKEIEETRQRILAENKLKHDKVAPVRKFVPPSTRMQRQLSTISEVSNESYPESHVDLSVSRSMSRSDVSEPRSESPINMSESQLSSISNVSQASQETGFWSYWPKSIRWW